MSLHITLSQTESVDVFRGNTTHNHGKLARALGIYQHLWRPHEIEITEAHQLSDPLFAALKKLRANPEFYSQYDAENGWGSAAYFSDFIEEVLRECLKHPNARVSVSV